MNLRLQVCLALSPVLYGCVHTADYPADWPSDSSQIVGPDCPVISGSYNTRGRSANGNNSVTDLTSWVLGLPQTSKRDGGQVTIRSKGQDISVSLADPADLESDQITLVLGRDFACNDGRLWIAESSWADPQAGGGLIIAKESTRISFHKTDDGSLLGELIESGGGVFMLIGLIPIPGAARSTDYIIWSAID